MRGAIIPAPTHGPSRNPGGALGIKSEDNETRRRLVPRVRKSMNPGWCYKGQSGFIGALGTG